MYPFCLLTIVTIRKVEDALLSPRPEPDAGSRPSSTLSCTWGLTRLFVSYAGYYGNAAVGRRRLVRGRCGQFPARARRRDRTGGGHCVRGPGTGGSFGPYPELGQRRGPFRARRRQLRVQHRRGTRLHRARPGGRPPRPTRGRRVQDPARRRPVARVPPPRRRPFAGNSLCATSQDVLLRSLTGPVRDGSTQRLARSIYSSRSLPFSFTCTRAPFIIEFHFIIPGPRDCYY